MTISDRLYETLGPLVSNRAYPVRAPEQCVRPYLVWQEVGNAREGRWVAGANYTTFRPQVSVVADTYDQAVALRRAVLDAVRLMPEHVPADDEVDSSGYDEERNLYTWILDFRLRAAD